MNPIINNFKTDSIFIWVRNQFEIRILVYLMKKYKYDCSKIENKIKDISCIPQWIRINRTYSKIELRNNYDISISSANTITLKSLNKWGPYTDNETRRLKIISIL